MLQFGQNAATLCSAATLVPVRVLGSLRPSRPCNQAKDHSSSAYRGNRKCDQLQERTFGGPRSGLSRTQVLLCLPGDWADARATCSLESATIDQGQCTSVVGECHFKHAQFVPVPSPQHACFRHRRSARIGRKVPLQIFCLRASLTAKLLGFWRLHRNGSFGLLQLRARTEDSLH